MSATVAEPLDALYDQSVEITRSAGEYSGTRLRDAFRIGSDRAKKIVEQMRANHVIPESVPPAENIRLVAISQIVTSARNAKRMAHVQQAKLVELASSLREIGLRQPIGLRKIAEDQYRIIFGERRYSAAIMNGWTEIKAVIMDVKSDAEEHLLRVMENRCREDLPPLVEADTFADLRAEGMTPDDIAQKFGLSLSLVYGRLRLNNLSPRWRKELEDPESDYAPFVPHITWLEQIAGLPVETQDYLLEERSLAGASTLERVKALIAEELRVIEDAPFDDQRFSKHQRCKGCPHRSDADGQLFPELCDDKKARCCRPVCWDEKLLKTFEWAIEELLKSGHPHCGFLGNGRLDKLVPERLKKSVEEWKACSTWNLFESAEDAQHPRYSSPVEIRFVRTDMGREFATIGTAWLRGDLIPNNQTTANDGTEQDDQSTPLMLAARQILAEHFPEVAPQEPATLFNLLRLTFFFASYNNDFAARSASEISGYGDGMVVELWAELWRQGREYVAEFAEGQYDDQEVAQDLALVLDWLGVPDAVKMLPAPAQSLPAGSADESDDDSDGEE